MKSLAGWTGRSLLRAIGSTGSLSVLVWEVLVSTLVDPFRGRGGIRFRASLIEMVRTGVQATGVVGMIGLFLGVVLALQGAYQLEKFGITILVVDLVVVGMTREIGPLLTAVLVAGRSGSSITAEIGAMKVAEEVDALRSMGLNPTRFLAVPKFIALTFMVPCLTQVANLLGMIGGALIAKFVLGITFMRFAERTAEALVMRDILSGLVKSLVFANIVAAIGCWYGFRVKGGGEEVGISTTASVVTSIFLILLADVVFTAIFYALP